MNGLKIGRTPVFAAGLLFSLLLGQMILEVQSTITPTTVVTEIPINVDLWIESKSLRIQANYTMRRIDTIQYGMQFTHLYANGRITVNGERLLFEFRTERYPTYKIYAESGLSSGPVRYIWDGITFISVESTPYHVEYDHVDNGPYSPPTYDIPPNEADPTTLEGSAKFHHHIPQWTIKDMLQTGALTRLASAVGGLILAVLMLPEPLISKTTALFLTVLVGVLTGLGLLVTYFADHVLKTELDDGWTWVWGANSRSWLGWTIFWWRESFGRWRDWGWLFAFLLPPFSSARFEAHVGMSMTICAW